MVRSSPGIKLFLVLVTVMLSAVTMAPSLPILSPQKELQDDDSAARVERSTNLSHITGTGQKIRMYIMHKFLQMFADGTVNVTEDEGSDYIILRRMSVNAGQVKIQGVATCTFLCMDSCGFLYSTREFGDECVFNEILEQSYQNMYTSVRYSNSKRTLYLAIGKGGIPRKLQVNANHTLGKKSTYVEVLPQLIKPEQIEQLENRLLAMYPNVPHHSLRHHQLCPPSIHTKLTMSHQCRKQPKKRKKRKGNDKGEDEDSSAAQDPKVPSGGKKKNDKEGDHSTKKGKKRRVEKKKTPKSQASKSPDRGNIMEDDETTTEFLDDEK